MSEYDWDKIITEGKIKYGDKEETFDICKDDLENMRKLKETFPYTMGVFNSNEYNYNDYLTGFFIKNEQVVGIRLEEENGTFVGDTIGNFKHLQKLRFCTNSIDEKKFIVPQAIGELKSLKCLEIYEDEDGSFELPEGIEPFPNLEIIELGGPIKKIPDWISELPSLKSLLLKDMEIDSFPPNFKKLSPNILHSYSDKNIKELWKELHGIEKFIENTFSIVDDIELDTSPSEPLDLDGTPLDFLKLEEACLKKLQPYDINNLPNYVIKNQPDLLKIYHCGEGFGHVGEVKSFFFSIDGKYIITFSSDESIVFWDYINNKHEKTIVTSKDGEITSMAYSSDGKMIASAHINGMINLWGGITYKKIGSIQGSKPDYRNKCSPIISLVFSSNNELLASFETKSMIIIWNVKPLKLVKKLLVRQDCTLTQIRFTNNDKNLIADTDIVNIEKDEYVFESYKNDCIPSMIAPFNNQFLYAITDRENIIIWKRDCDEFFDHPIVISKGGDIISIGITTDQKTLLSSHSNNYICKWKIPELELLEKKEFNLIFTKKYSNKSTIEISPNQKYVGITIQFSKKLIQILHEKELEPIHQIVNVKFVMDNLCVCPKHDLLVCSFRDEVKNTKIFDLFFFSLSDFHLKKAIKLYIEPITFINTTFDSKYLIIIGEKEGLIHIINMDTLKLINSIHRTYITQAKISNNEKMLAISIIDDGTCEIEIWDILTGHLIQKVLPNAAYAKEVMLNFSADDKTLIYRRKDNEIQIWDIIKKKHDENLGEHTKTIRDIEFVSKTNKIVSSSDDKTLKIWDWETRKLEKTISFEEFRIDKIKNYKNSEILFFNCSDSIVRVFSIPDEKFIREFDNSFQIVSMEIYYEKQQLFCTTIHGDLLAWDIAFLSDLFKV
jgi:WD40 repeat protein